MKDDGQLADNTYSFSNKTEFYEDPVEQASMTAGYARDGRDPYNGKKGPSTAPVDGRTQGECKPGCKKEDPDAAMPAKSTNHPSVPVLTRSTASSSTQPNVRQAMPTPPTEWAMLVPPTLPFVRETSRKRGGSHDLDCECSARMHTPSPRSYTPKRPNSAQLPQQSQEERVPEGYVKQQVADHEVFA